MQIVCLSDTHGLHDRVEVPDGDLLIVAGDICAHGRLADVSRFNQWLKSLPHRHKVVIAGNHDRCFEHQPEEARRLLTAGIYLEDEETTVEGFLVYGSPWQPWFYDWAFNLPRGEALRAKWAQIPLQVDILITHGPPAGILDRTSQGRAAGCGDLLQRIEEIQPGLHIFGHIHEGYGQHRVGNTDFVNASICDLRYRPVNPPLCVELPHPRSFNLKNDQRD